MTIASIPNLTIDAGGCWTWTGRLNRNGYGRIKLDGVERAAHRVVYQILRGHVPVGKVLDHRPGCLRSCCNPAHLTPVSPRENTLRGRGPTARNARKTHCHKGHALPPKDSRGRRECKTCKARRGKEGKR